MVKRKRNDTGTTNKAKRKPLISRQKTALEKVEEQEANLRAIFPFHRLCQELQDQIYDECLVARSPHPLVKNLHLNVFNVADPNLLLVSKGFSAQYGHRANTAQIMTVTDDCPRGDPADYGSDDLVIPVPALTIKELHIHLFILHPWYSGADHRVWISKLLAKLPAVRELNIRAVIGREHVQHYIEEDDESLTTLPLLKSFKGYMRCKDWIDFDDCKQVIVEWEPLSGEMRQVVTDEELAKAVDEASWFPYPEEVHGNDSTYLY